MINRDDITLRALEPDDVELLYKWENDPETWKVSSTRGPVSKFMLASYIKSCDKDFWESREMRLIIESIEGEPYGSVELFDFDPFHMRAGVGIIVFEKGKRRRGIATAALEFLIDYSLNELGIYQLWANVAESNEPSLKLFQKMGFEIAGLKKNWLKIPGKGWEGEYLLQKIL
ncbi:MAG: GNAT family N-acetyltransferase [Prolixibacteraceae bacterium]|nr:GNAT family N-acetyltransferase [Prolixibacteraceae bacterium]